MRRSQGLVLLGCTALALVAPAFAQGAVLDRDQATGAGVAASVRATLISPRSATLQVAATPRARVVGRWVSACSKNLGGVGGSERIARSFSTKAPFRIDLPVGHLSDQCTFTIKARRIGTGKITLLLSGSRF